MKVMSRPRAEVSAAAICAWVMAAGPVSVYVAPLWPASVSVVAATAAMSRTSTALTVAVPIGA
jgi:hypothetical protein